MPKNTAFYRDFRSRKRAVIRVIRQYAVLLIFAALCVGLFIGIKIGAHDQKKKMGDYGRERRITSYQIKEGDTLWSIASDLITVCPEYDDVRDYIAEIEQINGLHGDTIKRGNSIIIPYYIDDENTNAIYEKYGIPR